VHTALHVVAASGGAPRRLTSRDERVTSPRFSPDGRRIAFLSDRSGDPQAFVLDLAGGEAEQATSLPGGANDVLWAPDGKALLVVADVDPRCVADAACGERADAAARGRPRVATRLLFRHWNEWRERVRSHVLRVPLDGGPPVDLTPGDRDVPPASRGHLEDLAVSADGRTLWFTAISDPVEAISTNADLHAVPLAGGDAVRVTRGAGWDGSPRPSPDGKLLAWRSQERAGYESDRFRVMVANADGSAARDLTAGTELSAGDLHWARGEALRFTALVAGYHALFEVDVRSGKIERLTAETPRSNVTALSYSADGSKVAALVDSMTVPAEVAVLARKGARLAFEPLTSFATAALEGVARPEVRRLRATSKDGTTVHGWLVVQRARRDEDRRPAMVLLHGGPQGAWNDAWTGRWNAMLYAAQGYAVVLPNPRGSTGFGQKFVDEISQDWGGKVMVDLDAVFNEVSRLPYADPQRMGIAGASYGGYAVNWIIGHTDRFKAAVSHDGVFNIESMALVTEELWFPEWDFGGAATSQAARANFDKWSPHRHAEKIKTPTLVITNELDYRVPVDQGIQLFTALRRNGVPSEMLIVPDEGHWVLKALNSRVWHEAVFAWLQKYLAPAPRS
jgi:dipeptidyl aminopeptidase/acylaminoacyl peptidase